MKCPYCSKEMERGYIYNDTAPLEWIPKGKKPSIFKFKSSADGVKLTNEFSVFKVSGYSAEAYYCNSCHVVIAKTER